MRCSQGTHRDSARGRRPTPAGHTGASFSVGLGWVDMQPRHRTPRDSGLPLMMPLLMPYYWLPHISTLASVTRGSSSSTTGVALTRFASSTAMLPQRFFRSTLAPALISSFTCDERGRVWSGARWRRP